MRNRPILWLAVAAAFLGQASCDPPPSRIAGTWKNDWAIEHGEMEDRGGLVLGEDGTMSHSVFLPNGSSARSKGTYVYEDGVLVVTETESYTDDPFGKRTNQTPVTWGGPVDFLSSEEIVINDVTQGPIRLVRQK